MTGEHFNDDVRVVDQYQLHAALQLCGTSFRRDAVQMT
jgi:hypothetical protein